jgi:hypothetical protein
MSANPGAKSSYELHQIVSGCGTDSIFIIFYLDRINRIIRDFFACGEEPFGRRPHYTSHPVDPVQSIFKNESNPLFLSNSIVFIGSDRLFRGQQLH